MSSSILHGSFRSVPRTGVIYVTTEAMRRGFTTAQSGEWCNLGQGMPECGDLRGAQPRIQSIVLDDLVHEYSPVAGIPELRNAVAELYNRRYRKGKKSQYTAENVAIAPGGRASLTRIAAALGSIHLGHFLPDYTAYEELLDVFKLFTPTPIALDRRENFSISLNDLKREIMGRGLGALLLSNPCNPTGHVIQGEDLKGWVSLARELDCSMIFDEFYSHYVWGTQPRSVSAAEYVQDVNEDPILIVDGLTKNWRYAGWRVAWTLGPKEVIESISSAASFLDGGASRPLQTAALPLLSELHSQAELDAIHSEFSRKRELLLNECKRLNLNVDVPPQGTFYAFADVSSLPKPISTGMGFFQHALDKKVICVPGEFFDVNPGKRRKNLKSRFESYVRLSFGPSFETVRQGCVRIEEMISAFS